MPKFYVSMANVNIIVNARDPVEACAIASERTGTISIGCSWRVSEKGFCNHTDDEYIPDHLIIDLLKKRRTDKNEFL